MATKTHGAGTKLQYDADGTPPYTDLTDIKGITPPNLERSDAENTALDNANRARTFQASWIDGGEAQFMGYFTKAQFATLLGFFATGTEYFWRVLFPLIGSEANNSRIDFNGYVKKVAFDEINTDDKGMITCPFAIKVSGLPTFTQGS